MLSNTEPPKEIKKDDSVKAKKQTFDFYWFKMEIEKDNGIIRKLYKTQGELNGDYLEQKYDCCSILHTDQGLMIVTICPKTMKVENKGNSKFYNI